MVDTFVLFLVVSPKMCVDRESSARDSLAKSKTCGNGMLAVKKQLLPQQLVGSQGGSQCGHLLRWQEEATEVGGY